MELSRIVRTTPIIYHIMFALLSAKTCAAVMDPESGSVVYDTTADGSGNYPIGTVATYTCNIGNGLNGMASRTCVGDGSSTVGDFDGNAPTCERK